MNNILHISFVEISSEFLSVGGGLVCSVPGCRFHVSAFHLQDAAISACILLAKVNLRYFFRTSRILQASWSLSCAANLSFSSSALSSESLLALLSGVACKHSKSQLCMLNSKFSFRRLSTSSRSCFASSSANSLSRYNRFLAESLSKRRNIVVDLSSSLDIKAANRWYSMGYRVHGFAGRSVTHQRFALQYRPGDGEKEVLLHERHW
jgi:hypothetical protein